MIEVTKVGVVGVGALGSQHIHRLCTAVAGVQLTLVAGKGPENTEKMRQQYGVEAAADGFELIASPKVEAVVIASPDDTHLPLALACIAAGKPVFCEKPLAPTAAGCRQVMEAEEKAGRRLVQLGFMRRYDKHHRQLRAAIAEGAIGEVLMAHCVHRNPAMPQGFTSAMEVSNAAIHELDALRFLLGEEVVRCRVEKARPSRHAAGVRDPMLLLMETESGVLIDIEVFTNCRYGFDIRCEVVGEEGTLSLPQSASVVLKQKAARSTREYNYWQERYHQAYDLELQHWAQSLPTGRAAGPSAWDGYAAAVMADALIRSIETGADEPVELMEQPALYAGA